MTSIGLCTAICISGLRDRCDARRADGSETFCTLAVAMSRRIPAKGAGEPSRPEPFLFPWVIRASLRSQQEGVETIAGRDGLLVCDDGCATGDQLSQYRFLGCGRGGGPRARRPAGPGVRAAGRWDERREGE